MAGPENASDVDSQPESVRVLRRKASFAPGVDEGIVWRNARVALVAMILLVTPAVVVVATRSAPQPPQISDCVVPSAAARGPSDVTVLEADVDGDGCDDRVTIGGGRVQVTTAEETAAFAVGEPTDQIVVGDWNCNGTATPVLYRPATGLVYHYDRWPEDVDPVRPRTTAATAQGHAQRYTEDGCDRLRVVKNKQ